MLQTEESTVVPFRTRRRKLVTTVEVVIDGSKPLETGDLVAFIWPSPEGKPQPTMFDYWEGPTGRDGNGKIVKKGSRDEFCSLGYMKYSVKDVEAGRIKILGKVIYGLEPVTRPIFVEVQP